MGVVFFGELVLPQGMTGYPYDLDEAGNESVRS